MLRTLFTLLILISVVGCGKEEGVKARLYQKTILTPKMVEDQAINYLDKSTKTSADLNSLSSQAIRNDTLGFRIKSVPGANDSLDFRIEHFDNLVGDRCRNTYQDVNITSSKRNTIWTETDTLKLMCLNYSCDTLILVLKRASSSFYDGNGAIVRAYVPIILHAQDPVNGPRYYIAGTTADSMFLRLKNDVNTICTKSDLVNYVQTQIAISPEDDNGPRYDYFPHDDNNTWIYN
jgi:hypothetical protein